MKTSSSARFTKSVFSTRHLIHSECYFAFVTRIFPPTHNPKHSIQIDYISRFIYLTYLWTFLQNITAIKIRYESFVERFHNEFSYNNFRFSMISIKSWNFQVESSKWTFNFPSSHCWIFHASNMRDEIKSRRFTFQVE